jgi:ectoine hydroxylase-related dioxygenase (phytanoyl-CoA dioxygenase family)
MLERLCFDRDGDLSKARDVYEEAGVFVVRNLLDREQIEGIQATISSMIRERLTTLSYPSDAGDDLDALYNRLCDADRRYGGQVYDHVKDLPEYYSLLVDTRIRTYVAALLGTPRFQVPFDICLFRIDRPSEDKFTFDWHQDYPYNLISQNAVTVWFPLTDIDNDMGLLKVVPGAHRSVVPVEVVQKTFKPGQGGGGKSIRMASADFDRFERDGIEVPMRAGDVMFFHCMTPHRSGLNRSKARRARWVMNPRYGELLDPSMVSRGWQCVTRDNFFLFPHLHPELVVESDSAAVSEPVN